MSPISAPSKPFTPLDEGIKLRIATAYDPEGIDIGASIACSGVCLTVTTLPEEGANGRWFEVEAWEEALRLTTISSWKAGQPINLERSLKIGDELGGHLVSGHVDGKAEILSVRPKARPPASACARRSIWQNSSPRRAPSRSTAPR